MTVDSFISFLTQSPWVLLTGLILVLGVAFADTFSQKPSRDHPSRTDHHRPR